MDTDNTPPNTTGGVIRSDGNAPPATPGPQFMVVGLGASAGGIGALSRFFDHMPTTSGMAFVVVIHLSPDHESKLAQLLQTHTTMPVTQVVDAVPIQPNHVYVIPPAKYLTMGENTILLTDPQPGKGRRIPVPIDHFFRTLAESHGPRAAGVVLTGSGADGTIGLPRIKELGGVTVVQDPNEAEYDEMPRSAIATGMADYVLSLAEIPEQLIGYWANVTEITLPGADDSPKRVSHLDELGEILAFLRLRTGHNFAAYKHSTVLRRLERRMQVNDRPSLGDYLTFLRQHPAEIQALLRDLLISVTNFFRDHEAWEALEREVLPRLFQNADSREGLRVWVAGCATGEEAYSVAILLHEYTRKLDAPPKFQIFATDLDERAINVAREGSYPETIALDVSSTRLRQFFTHEGGRYHIRKEVRDTILFAVHDVLKDPPFSRLDLITCRNLLIYLNREAQEQLLTLFHFALKPNATLFLGMSESTDGVAHLYNTSDKKHHLYTRRAIPRALAPLPSLPLSKPDQAPLPELGSPHTGDRPIALSKLHSNVLEQYAPPSVLINENYDIVHLSNRAGRYMQFSGGEPSYNLLRTIHPDLRLDLRSALYTALQKGQANATRRVLLHLDGVESLVRLIVQQVQEPEALRGYALVIFDEIQESADGATAPQSSELEPLTRQLEEEVQILRGQLRVTIEQYETSVEELRASNEELQAMNEELRSTTEELETGKEELQAVNEELQTVNQEMRSKVEEISQINNDLQNLITSTDIGTVFLDRDLRIKRYTRQMQRLFNIIPSDINRPLAHVTHKLNYHGLVEDAQQVLQQLSVIEREIQTSSGEWYIVRLLPYRSQDERIDGVVLTFVDMTVRFRAAREREALIQQLAEQQAQLEAVVQQMPVALIVANAPDGPIVYSNAQARSLWPPALPSSLAEFSTAYRAFAPDGTPLDPADWPLARTLRAGDEVTDEEVIMKRTDGQPSTMLISTTPVRDERGQVTAGVMTWYDVSARQRIEALLRAARAGTEERIAARITEHGEATAAHYAEIAERQATERTRRDDWLRRIVDGREEEQRRISRELHDQFGQSLTGLKFILNALARRAARSQQEQLEEAVSIVDDLSNWVSELALDLRPAVLDDMGVIPALISLIGRFTAQTGVVVDFQHNGMRERFDPEVETVIYRVVQEALTNVARHSGATEARVRIFADGVVVVRVEDSGCGLAEDARHAPDSTGLIGMSERVALIGGSLVIESASGTGTRIIAQLPRKASRQSKAAADPAEDTA